MSIKIALVATLSATLAWMRALAADKMKDLQIVCSAFSVANLKRSPCASWADAEREQLRGSLKR